MLDYLNRPGSSGPGQNRMKRLADYGFSVTPIGAKQSVIQDIGIPSEQRFGRHNRVLEITKSNSKSQRR